MTSRFAQSEIVRRWSNILRYDWDESSKECAVCQKSFRTGDVSLVFGRTDAVIAVSRWACENCGWQLVKDGAVPSGAAVFVQDCHRDRDLDQLNQTVRDRVVEGFTIVDRLADAMEQIGKAGEEAVTRKPS